MREQPVPSASRNAEPELAAAETRENDDQTGQLLEGAIPWPVELPELDQLREAHALVRIVNASPIKFWINRTKRESARKRFSALAGASQGAFGACAHEALDTQNEAMWAILADSWSEELSNWMFFCRGLEANSGIRSTSAVQLYTAIEKLALPKESDSSSLSAATPAILAALKGALAADQSTTVALIVYKLARNWHTDTSLLPRYTFQEMKERKQQGLSLSEGAAGPLCQGAQGLFVEGADGQLGPMANTSCEELLQTERANAAAREAAMRALRRR